METIVYIILAVLVLAVLLYFLTSQSNPVIDQTKLEQKRAQLCAQYASYDRTCKNPGSVSSQGVKTQDNKDLVPELLATCDKIPSAASPIDVTDQAKRIQRCCYTCLPSP